MDSLRYLLFVFRRRLAAFLAVATVLAAVSLTVALALPPAYESRMVLLVEAPQIPEELAASTVQTPAFEQLQILQQQLLTRQNLLDIARKLTVLPDQRTMNADQIVEAMRARTRTETSSQRQKEAPVLTVTFEAPEARTAAAVLNEYLTLIQRQDTEFRRGRAGETLEFFSQEVSRLGQELDAQSARILRFKQANTGALPESLDFRLDQQASYQDRLLQIGREIGDLRGQGARLRQLYELTGASGPQAAAQPSAEARQLAALNSELEAALAVYSPENPRVKMLEARIAQLEARIGQAPPDPAAEAEAAAPEAPLPPVLTIQLQEIESRIAQLQQQETALQGQLEILSEGITRTPEVAVALEEMTRRYEALQTQYTVAEDRLSKAQTGDRIEARSRGQRITVIEQPAVPSQPTKPNRLLIAGGGTALGVLAGLGVIFLLEMLSSAAQRPEDLIGKLGITPLTTIPYIQTRSQMLRQRTLKTLMLLAILVGIPAAVFAIHTYYLPLDLLADRAMNKMGVRW